MGWGGRGGIPDSFLTLYAHTWYPIRSLLPTPTWSRVRLPFILGYAEKWRFPLTRPNGELFWVRICARDSHPKNNKQNTHQEKPRGWAVLSFPSSDPFRKAVPFRAETTSELECFVPQQRDCSLEWATRRIGQVKRLFFRKCDTRSDQQGWRRFSPGVRVGAGLRLERGAWSRATRLEVVLLAIRVKRVLG